MFSSGAGALPPTATRMMLMGGCSRVGVGWEGDGGRWAGRGGEVSTRQKKITYVVGIIHSLYVGG